MESAFTPVSLDEKAHDGAVQENHHVIVRVDQDEEENHAPAGPSAGMLAPSRHNKSPENFSHSSARKSAANRQ